MNACRMIARCAEHQQSAEYVIVPGGVLAQAMEATGQQLPVSDRGVEGHADHILEYAADA